MTSLLYLFEFFAVGMIFASGQDVLGAYNVDPSSVSISGFSSGGFMTAQLGVAYSDVFKVGFGVFAGGPYDCARNQNAFNNCMYDSTPSIDTPTANMKSWSGIGIANVANLRSRRVYMQTGSADAVIGPNVMGQLRAQLSNFVDSKKVTYVTTTGAAHTFPANFDSRGDSPCDTSAAPYISNCDYDGAGAVLQWLYGDLNPRNTASLSGKVVPFAQSGSYGAPGMDATAYLYVPPSCQDSSTICKLHVVLHGCTQAYGFIGDSFINNTGYNMWADTNDIIVLFPQAVVDNTIRRTWDGTLRNNSLGCWDWIGQYGPNTDQIGGVQMVAIVNQVRRIISGYQGNSALRSAHSMLRRYLPSGLRYILSSA